MINPGAKDGPTTPETSMFNHINLALMVDLIVVGSHGRLDLIVLLILTFFVNIHIETERRGW